MIEQVLKVEKYCQRVVQQKNLDKDSKLLILWDVYCRHHDNDLIMFRKTKLPNLIVVFVPVNLTELIQPLDRAFNAQFKCKLNRLHEERMINAASDWWMATQDRFRKDAVAAEKEYEVNIFSPAMKLSDIKEPFYSDLTAAGSEEKKKLQQHAWCNGLFEQCFDRQFQSKAVQLVTDGDALRFGSKYFAYMANEASTATVDPVLEGESNYLVLWALDVHVNNALHTPMTNQSSLPPKNLVGRHVACDGDEVYGVVSKYKPRKKAFVVKFFGNKDQHSSASAKSSVEMTYELVLGSLAYDDDDG